jgi:hypothetical protein
LRGIRIEGQVLIIDLGGIGKGGLSNDGSAGSGFVLELFEEEPPSQPVRISRAVPMIIIQIDVIILFNFILILLFFVVFNIQIIRVHPCPQSGNFCTFKLLSSGLDPHTMVLNPPGSILLHDITYQ